MPPGRDFPVSLVALGAGFLVLTIGGVAFAMKRRRDVRQWRDLIVTEARAQGVDPALVAAIMEQESGGDPAAVRVEPLINDRSLGLMQLLCATARRICDIDRCDSLFDPQTNVRCGVRYLARLTRLFPGDEDRVIAAYNGGEGVRFERVGFLPPRRVFSNQKYVDGVKPRLARFRSKGEFV